MSDLIKKPKSLNLLHLVKLVLKLVCKLLIKKQIKLKKNDKKKPF